MKITQDRIVKWNVRSNIHGQNADVSRTFIRVSKIFKTYETHLPPNFITTLMLNRALKQKLTFSDYRDSGKVCGLGELSCLQGISADLRKISQGNYEALKDLKEEGIECECPSGNESDIFKCNINQISK